MLLKQTQKQTLSQRIDPKLILANTVLACSTLELTQAIEQELAENPALERPDEDVCAGCKLPRELCADCPLKVRADTPADTDEVDWREWYAADPDVYIDQTFRDDSDFDPLSNVGVQRTLQDHLVDQLRASGTDEQFRIGEYLVGSINHAGYFEGNLDDMAADLDVDVSVVENVLRMIQSFEPPGVGARNLQECLALQLRNMDDLGEIGALALRMVEERWPDTTARKVGRIARRLRTSQKNVLAALELIRYRLTPYPGEGFRDPWDSASETRNTVQPDVIVRRTLAGYEIDVVTNDYQALALNAQYRDAYAHMRNGGARFYSNKERKHISEYVERAENFIRSIIQRRKTLKAITKFVIEHQQGYIETGQKSFLRPLTRTRLATALSIHESTVSRATRNKWVQLPSEEVVTFDMFFDGSMSVKDLILDIIAAEDKAHPLSDQDIAEILQGQGLDVARRTVAKYRESQNILSSRQRRRSS